MLTDNLWINNAILLIAAFCADAVLGDPRLWPHIAKAAGWLARFWERCLAGEWIEPLGGGYFVQNPKRTILRGAVFWLAVCGAMLSAYFLISAILGIPVLRWLLDAAIIYQAIATRDLANHVLAILKPLQLGDLTEARSRLSWIVGRDTATLTEPEVCRASIEAVAESLCDGVIAPLFWAAVLGAPGALLYRAANTLDSIVGHRTPRYEAFGKFSARADDLLNWIPARLTAAILWLLTEPLRPHWWSEIAKEALQHASPNAGWPEAAMARILGVRLGGANVYSGERIDGPVFFEEGSPPTLFHVALSLKTLWFTAVIALAILVFGIALFHFILTQF